MKHLLFFVAVYAMASARGQVSIEPSTIPPVELSAFGGDVVEFTLVVDSSSDGEILLTYDLFQIADRLLVQLEKNRSAGQISERDSRRRLRVQVPVPKVDGPTRMMVNFSMNPPPGKSLLGRSTAWLNVFPKPKQGERASLLAAAEAKSGRRLAVFGESTAIRDFFKAEGIAFEDLGTEWPRELSGNRLLIGEVTADQWEKFNPIAPGREILVFIVSGAFLPPGIYRTVFANHVVTKVTLPLPVGLLRSPLDQNLFLDLIKQQLHPAGTAATP